MSVPAGTVLVAHDLSLPAYGGDPVSHVRALCRQTGCREVWLKAHDGASAGVATVGSFEAQFHAAAPALAQGGLVVRAYGYNRFDDTAGEAARIRQALSVRGCSGYLFDAESPCSGRYVQARQVVSDVLSRMPGASLGHMPAPGQNYPPDYPWAAFAPCEFVAPMVYWLDWSQEPAAALKAAIRGCLQNAPRQRILPIGSLGAPAAQRQAFAAAAEVAACPGCAWWCADTGGPDLGLTHAAWAELAPADPTPAAPDLAASLAAANARLDAIRQAGGW